MRTEPKISKRSKEVLKQAAVALGADLLPEGFVRTGVNWSLESAEGWQAASVFHFSGSTTTSLDFTIEIGLRYKFLHDTPPLSLSAADCTPNLWRLGQLIDDPTKSWIILEVADEAEVYAVLADVAESFHGAALPVLRQCKTLGGYQEWREGSGDLPIGIAWRRGDKAAVRRMLRPVLEREAALQGSPYVMFVQYYEIAKAAELVGERIVGRDRELAQMHLRRLESEPPPLTRRRFSDEVELLKKHLGFSA